MSTDPNANPNVSPVNPMPPVVVALFLVIFGVECVFALGSEGLVGGANAVDWRLQAIQKYAFSGPIFDWMIENNRWPVEHLIRPDILFVQIYFPGKIPKSPFLL